MSYILIFWLSIVQPDGYLVVYVNGNAEVVNAAGAAQKVIQGYRLNDGDRIQFLSPSSYVRLAGKGGTYQLRPGYDSRTAGKGHGALSGLVRDLLLPAPVSGEMRSRGAAIASLIHAERAFATYRDSLRPLLIIDRLELPFSKEFITDTANQTFYLSYLLNGDTISKKLSWDGSHKMLQLQFDRRLFWVDGKDNGAESLPPCEILYYDTRTHQLSALGKIQVRYLSFAALQPQLCGIRKATGRQDSGIMLDYIRAWYGLTDEAYFTDHFLPLLNCR